MSRLLPFVVNVLVARRLTPEEFGVPTVCWATYLLHSNRSREPNVHTLIFFIPRPCHQVHFQLFSTIILTCREVGTVPVLRASPSGPRGAKGSTRLNQTFFSQGFRRALMRDADTRDESGRSQGVCVLIASDDDSLSCLENTSQKLLLGS